MEVGQIDCSDVWCDEIHNEIRNEIPPPPQRNDVRHTMYPTDRLVPTILKGGPLLGSGRYGQVFRMTERKTGTHVAVKIMKRFVMGNATFARALRKVFERELTILRLCKHPNIIQLLQSIETPETAYLVLELCEQSLFNVVVERGGLRESEMRRVVRAASAGLTYLHSKEIAHRDLKLTNILCSRNPQDGRDLFWSIKLSDFGLAACRGPSGTRRLFTCYCGTPEFMAPELLMKDPYDTKCDCWSLGVVIYVCLIGQQPFPGASEEEVKASIWGSQVALNDGVWMKFSQGLKSVLKRMLIVDPLTRLSALQIHDDAWTQNRRTSPAPKKGRRKKASKTLLERVRKCMDELVSEQQEPKTN